MHGSYNRFMLQSVKSHKAYVSKVHPDKPGASIDVEVTADGCPWCGGFYCDCKEPVEIKPTAYEVIGAVTKLKKELQHLEEKKRATTAWLDGLPGTANGGELI